MRDAREHVGLVLAQPRELRDRERRHRHRADRVGPRLRAPRSYQRVGLRRRLGVVPELGRPQHPALVVEHDHAVLLARHADRLDVAAVLVEQRRQRCPTIRRGSCSLRGGTVGGCGRWPDRTSSPVSASRTSSLQDCVEESIPATSVTRPPRALRRRRPRTRAARHPPRRRRRRSRWRRPVPARPPARPRASAPRNGSSRKSNASAASPPTTTSSGLRMLTRYDVPRPSMWPASSSTRRRTVVTVAPRRARRRRGWGCAAATARPPHGRRRRWRTADVYISRQPYLPQ